MARTTLRYKAAGASRRLKSSFGLVDVQAPSRIVLNWLLGGLVDGLLGGLIGGRLGVLLGEIDGLVGGGGDLIDDPAVGGHLGRVGLDVGERDDVQRLEVHRRGVVLARAEETIF